MPQCDASVYWWDGEFEDYCELPTDHEGHHSGRYACWDDDNEAVEGCEEHDD